MVPTDTVSLIFKTIPARTQTIDFSSIPHRLICIDYWDSKFEVNECRKKKAIYLLFRQIVLFALELVAYFTTRHRKHSANVFC